MPSPNIVKEFATDSYYHIYNRGVEARVIFHDDQDYTVFLGLLKKYLSGEKPAKDRNRHPFKNFSNEISLLAYCLMPNHFHLLLYQVEENSITELMRRVSTGYAMYFNDRYKRVGGLFQGVYKASRINDDAYLDHVSRYIHLNPDKEYDLWPYSSYSYYMGKKKAMWVNSSVILGLFNDSPSQYREFVEDYQDTSAELSALKKLLANDPGDM